MRLFKRRAKAVDTLTPSERWILCLIARGTSQRELARNMGVPDKDIKYATYKIRQKLHARNTMEAVAMVVKAGRI